MTSSIRSVGKLLLLLSWLVIFYEACYGQKLAKLSDVVPELQPAVTMSFPADQIDFLNPLSFGFTTQGVVAISKDRTTLVCYSPDGSIVWTRQPQEKVISAVHFSDSGNIISAYYPLSEDGGVTEVMTGDGRMLWRKVYRAGFRVSPNGKYLYSGPSALSGMPLTVIETESGAVLWQLDEPEFKAELLDEETLVYVSREEVKLMEMSTGNILTQKNISEPFRDELSYTNWELSESSDGNYVTLLGRSSKSLKVFVVTYDRNLKRVWSDFLEPGYPTLLGISENGSKLCIDRPETTKLYDNFTGNLLWQVEDKILNNGAVVTNGFIAVRQAGYESDVFVLGGDGSLTNRFEASSIYTQTKIPEIKTKKGAVNLLESSIKEWGSIVEIKKENAQESAIFYAN